MRAFLLSILLVALLPAAALACAPAVSDGPFGEAIALLHGRVIEVSPDGRRATLEILAYAGPGDAPGRVTLPATVSSRKWGQKCEDESVRFLKHEEYFVMLGGLPPDLRLALPQGKTAVRVGSHVGLNAFATFAAERGYSVVHPDASSPDWAPSRAGAPWLFAGAAAALGAGASSLLLLRGKQGR